MKLLFAVVASFLLLPALAQEKKSLQKQLVQVMQDYPNKFRNLQKKDEPFIVKFRISGTWSDPIIMGSGAGTYITAPLSTPRSGEEAKAIFDAWVSILDEMDLNGARLVGKDCPRTGMTIHCREWTFDNAANNIAAEYLPFTIKISFIEMNGAYAGSIQIR